MNKRFIYALGDIHGRLDLLELAASRINAHLDGRPGKFVFLGDYIDRGPDSSGVLDFLIGAQRAGGAVCLKGNHEDMMLAAVREPEADASFNWVCNGGDATLLSYGGDALRWRESLSLVPQDHLAWLASLPSLVTDEHRLYVHAGLTPGVRAEEQGEEVRLWIREKFLRAKRMKDFPDGKHIVHGHTHSWAGKSDPSAPELLAHRTNLDTAAYASGVLTIGVFDADRAGGPVEVMAVSLPLASP